MKTLAKIIYALGLLIVLTNCQISTDGTEGFFINEEQESELIQSYTAIHIDKADTLSLDINFGLGKFEITDWDKDSLGCAFKFADAKLEPSMELKEGIYYLKTIKNKQEDKNANIWKIKVPKNTALKLNIDAAVCEGNIRLQDATLKEIVYKMGIGSSKVWLSNETITADIQSGIGAATVWVPADANITAKIEKGIGAIEAPDFQESEDNTYILNADSTGKKMNMELETGIGIMELLTY